jgi:hypothetical protein
MTKEQRTVVLDYIKNIMTELDTRHACEMKELVSRHQIERRKKESEMSGLSAGLNDEAQPALFVVPVVAVEPVAMELPIRQFVDERHLYPKGRIHTLQGLGERPKRFRDDVTDVQEYFYPKGGRITFRGTQIGTIDISNKGFAGRWLTVHEAKTLHQGKE